MVGKQKLKKKSKSKSKSVTIDYLQNYGLAILIVIAMIMGLFYFDIFDSIRAIAIGGGYSVNESFRLCRSIGMENGDLFDGNMRVTCFIDNPSLPVKINHVYEKIGINKSELVNIYVEGYDR